MKNKYSSSRELADIFSQYDILKPENITFLSIGYYPLASLEVDMIEKTFENYELIELTVLKMFNTGIKDISLIAELLGLNARYAQSIRKVLEGNGHLDNGIVTPLGLESLLATQNITVKETSQVFRADGVTGNLIKRDTVFSKYCIDDIENLRIDNIFLEQIDGVEEKYLKQMLLGRDLIDYKQLNQDVLHVNVDSVNDIRFKKMEYIRGYIIKDRNFENYIFVTSLLEYVNNKKQYVWKPIIATKEDLIKMNCDIIFHNKESGVTRLQERVYPIIEYSNAVNLDEMIKNINSSSFIYISKTNTRYDNDVYNVDFNAQSIKLINKHVESGDISKRGMIDGRFIEMLEQISNNEVYLELLPRTFGKVFLFRTCDKKIIDLAKLYTTVALKRTKSNIKSNIKGVYFSEDYVREVRNLLKSLL